MYLAIPVTLMALIARPGAADGQARGTTLNQWRWYRNLLTKLPRNHCADFSANVRAIGYAIVCLMIAFSATYRWKFTYRDSPDRLTMRESLSHPKLRGVFTTSNRAQSLEELLRELQPLIRKDDYLFDHMQLSLVYFLTETRPYLYSSWANLYPPAVFQNALEKAVRERHSLPVVIMTKVDTSHREWPDKSFPPLPYYRHVENRRMVKSFLQDHSYKKHWENGAFQIWLPPNFDGKS
jgi:hypothetical protein